MPTKDNISVSSAAPIAVDHSGVADTSPVLDSPAGKQGKGAPGTVADCLRILQKMSGPNGAPPDAAECKILAAHIYDAENGCGIARLARYGALRLCERIDSDHKEAGILLLKELSKRGDFYAKLFHARLRWADGAFKDHQHARKLVDELLCGSYDDWLKWPDESFQAALGEVFRLNGLLLWQGNKVKRNPSEALRSLKFAADKYRDGAAAWLAAQFHAHDAAGEFADKAKPHAAAYEHYMKLASELGYSPEGEGADPEEQA